MGTRGRDPGCRRPTIEVHSRALNAHGTLPAAPPPWPLPSHAPCARRACPATWTPPTESIAVRPLMSTAIACTRDTTDLNPAILRARPGTRGPRPREQQPLERLPPGCGRRTAQKSDPCSRGWGHHQLPTRLAHRLHTRGSAQSAAKHVPPKQDWDTPSSPEASASALCCPRGGG
jgi:hypothetical protein